MFLGVSLEAVGYVTRIMLHNNPFDKDTFILYLIFLLKVDDGTDIMIAGMVFQVVSLFTFAALCAEFAWHLHKNRDKWNSDYTAIYNSCLFKLFIWSMIPIPHRLGSFFVLCLKLKADHSK